MIHEVEGDILLSKAAAIAHGVAPNDPMDQGLARALHERYPSMHKDFHHWCHQHSGKPGEAWAWGGAGGVRLVNLITQPTGPGRRPGKARVKDVNHALRALRKVVQKEGFNSVALPRLATGVGGLNWSDVQPLIEQQLGELDIPVYVYTTYRPGKVAKEPQL
jgi:O-acetyl-ADP-ribose deacetylase (regulator of RNase III)